MDGSVHVLHAATGELLASAKPHSKYVVAASWAPVLLTATEQQQQQQQQQEQEQGKQLIATASYDSTCCLLRLVSSSTDGSSRGTSGLALEVVQQVCLHPGFSLLWCAPLLAGMCLCLKVLHSND
jgi:hypothetical protein